MFFKKYNGMSYEGSVVSVLDSDTQNLHFPVEIDTEFQDRHYPFVKQDDMLKKTISIQMRPIKGAPRFYLHKDMFEHHSECKQFPIIKYDFAIYDLLEDLGHEIMEVTLDENTGIITDSKLYIHIYGFCLFADLMRLVDGDWRDMFESRINEKSHKYGNIQEVRRIKACNNRLSKYGIDSACLDTRNYISISNKIYRVMILFHDNASIQGKVSYATLCSNTGIKLEHKHELSTTEKKHMFKTFMIDQKRVSEYANDDLMNYDALEGHNELLRKLYELLGLELYFRRSKQTVGMCVFDLLESSMMKNFEFEKYEDLKKAVKEASHQVLISNLSSTQIYLAKTNGGRCYNNRPTEPCFQGVVGDIDIKGCYATGMSDQDYPIGRPIIIEYNKNSKINNYDTLNNFLRKYETELVDGLWFCRISTKENLSFEQDFFQSWMPSKDWRDIIRSDVDKEDSFEFREEDETRIYSQEIHLGVLQSDGLEWMRKYVCREEREELFEKIIVKSAAYYPKTKRCKAIQEYKEKSNKELGKNNTDVLSGQDDEFVIKKTTKENHYWYSLKIGEIIIDKLSELRAKYNKTNPEEAQMNQFIKLIINTTYGDLVSPHFYLANTVVGNNITARARTMAWYMEKALHGIQTITDGCTFELNKVVKTRYNFFNKKYVQMKKNKEIYNRNFSLGYLQLKKTMPETIEELKENNYKEITKQVTNHIRTVFKKASVVKKYELEMRGIYTGMSVHGPSNYQMYDGTKIAKTKMRSYTTNEYIEFDVETRNEKKEYSRTVEWLGSLYKDPENVKRTEPFVEENIVKVKQYQQQRDRLKNLGIGIGDIEFKTRLITECSISMFLYKNNNQYQRWKKEHNDLRTYFKQSYEGEFQKEEGNINYMQMVKEIQRKIDNGDNKFYKKQKTIIEHPKKEIFERTNIYIENKLKQLARI